MASTTLRAGTRRRPRRVLVAVLAVVFVLACATYVTLQVPAVRDLAAGDDGPADYRGPGSGSVVVVVGKDEGASELARALVEAGVVASAGAFEAAYAEDPNAALVRPGTYRLPTRMRAADVVGAMVAQVRSGDRSVTISEGFTVDQVLARVSAITGLSQDALRAAMKDTRATGLPAAAKGSYEGWFAPATYLVEESASATDVVAMMVSQRIAELDDLEVPRDERQHVLTVASLVQTVVQRPEDGPQMARAIENRLAHGMRLELDVTSAYGQGVAVENLTPAQVADTKDPYSTTAHTGLPPTPIATPGESALRSAIHPERGSWLFWAEDPSDGSMRFANTYADYLAATQEIERSATKEDG